MKRAIDDSQIDREPLRRGVWALDILISFTISVLAYEGIAQAWDGCSILLGQDKIQELSYIQPFRPAVSSGGMCKGSLHFPCLEASHGLLSAV